MSRDSIITIMGEPKKISAGNVFLTFPENYSVLSYENSNGTSDDIHIVVDDSDKMVSILSSDQVCIKR